MMRNIKQEVKNGKLILTIDLSKEYGLSNSGKTVQVASTLGNKPVDDENYEGYMIGVNVYKYPEPKK